MASEERQELRFQIQTGRVTQLMFSSCCQCGVRKMSKLIAQSAQCTFWEGCSGHWVGNGSWWERSECKETSWEAAAPARTEMPRTGQREVAVEMGKSRWSRERKVKSPGLYISWMVSEASRWGQQRHGGLTPGFGACLIHWEQQKLWLMIH